VYRNPTSDQPESRQTLLARAKAVLPSGGLLPAPEWQRRHHVLLGLLWVSTAILPVWSLLTSDSVLHSLAHGLVIVPLALAASCQRFSRRERSAFVSLGLLTGAGLLVHMTDGLIEAHFYFFVLVVALTLYEDWLPFLLAVGFVLLHHGIVGAVAPEQVYSHASAIAHPWLWASIHALFVALAGIAGVLAWRLNENIRQQMHEAHRELATLSVTDSLTQLPNRRKAMADLDALFNGHPEDSVLVMLDLDGFKSYNDTFGHPAGDALLHRLGGRLSAAMEGNATAYRLGGDEFCLIAPGSVAELVQLEATAAEALSEKGQGFHVTTSLGSCLIPAEAEGASVAISLADERMYANKESRRTSASNQSKDVLLRALSERHPDLELHLNQVSDLVEPLANELGLSESELRIVQLAAELHDVGKVAIPDAILDKPGPLTKDEWEFMQKHTMIGQRIVDAAPALAGIGPIIRSTHERWDGSGYPDGLKGPEIPLAARIIAIADTYDAMTADRPYQPALSELEAQREIRRCSGSQFDPQIAAAFLAVRKRDSRRRLAAVT
jgi:diguanylate cyclase (GGDEF)-like protein